MTWPQLDLVTVIMFLFWTIIGGIAGWVAKFLTDRYIMNLRYGQQIAQATIERVLGYAERYYFPLSSRGFQLVSALNAAVGTKDPDLKKDYLKIATYRLAQYLAADSRITKETGGLLLMKDFEVEKTIVQLKLEIVKWLPLRLSDREYLAEKGELNYTRFERLQDTKMRSIQRELETWVSDSSKVKSFCKFVICQNQLVTRELGNIYQPWYGKKPPPISKESEETIKGLKTDC